MIGKVLVCDDGSSYRIESSGRKHHELALIDEYGKIVNEYNQCKLEECIEQGKPICIGITKDFSELILAYVKEIN